MNQEGKKHWLTRPFSKPVPWQGKESAEKVQMARQMSLRRPRTAPSSGKPAMDESIPPVPPLPSNIQCLPSRQKDQAQLRSLRSDSPVQPDVDAWLDASLKKPSSPVMGGLSYWREGIPANAEAASGVQYLIPIVQEPDCERASTSHSQQIKSFCRRRAKKMQVRMPSIGRKKSSRAAGEDINARSTSSPFLAIPYEQTEEDTAPLFFTRMSAAREATRPSTATTPSQTVPVGRYLDAQGAVADVPVSRSGSGSMVTSKLEYDIQRCANAGLRQSMELGDTVHPGAAAASMPREDSMGSFSSAPTYFSGLPPPSYRSRPASILTISSFGCIDGMNPEQRELSKQRAVQRHRGMKGRLRKLAKRTNLTK